MREEAARWREIDWSYDAWPSGAPYDWSPATRGDHPTDQIDFHLDLGCGRLKKARIGIDHFASEATDFVLDLDLAGEHPNRRLPIPDNAIKSIVTHHCLEHIGEGFIRLMDECYRVLEPGGLFRIVVPLFPSTTAVQDPDHKRYFMAETFEAFCGTPGDTPNNCWLASFSVPYTQARFEMLEKDMTAPTPPEDAWGPEDAREIRLTLGACK